MNLTALISNIFIYIFQKNAFRKSIIYGKRPIFHPFIPTDFLIQCFFLQSESERKSESPQTRQPLRSQEKFPA